MIRTLKANEWTPDPAFDCPDCNISGTLKRQRPWEALPTVIRGREEVVRKRQEYVECSNCHREWYDFRIVPVDWGVLPKIEIRDGIDSDMVVVDPENGKRWPNGTVNVPDDPTQDFLQRQYEAIQGLYKPWE